MARFQLYILLVLLCVKVGYTAPNDGKEIADRFGEDLSFASKQVIRGFTAIFGPLLDTAQSIPHGFSKNTPGGGKTAESNANFRHVLLRDGINAIGKGVKASATILTVPARVVGTGLEEARKVGQVGLGSRHTDQKSAGSQARMDDKTKIASVLLNTTSSELSQANLGAVLVEVALKKRIKDIGNRTATFVESQRSPTVQARVDEGDGSSDKGTQKEESSTPSQVDQLIEQFNEAVRRNDERVLSGLKTILAQINPPNN